MYELTTVDKCKYVEVWLDEKLNPETHLKLYKPKMNYLISRFMRES